MLGKSVSQPAVKMKTQPEASPNSATARAEVAGKSHSIPAGSRTTINAGTVDTEVLARRIEKKNGEITDTRTTMTAELQQNVVVHNHGKVSVTELSS